MNPISDIQEDDSLWPLLIVRFVGEPTTPQAEAHLQRMETVLERGERYVALFDSSGVTGMGLAEQRHLQAAWMRKHDARLRELRLGATYVMHSPVFWLTVNVVLSLKPSPSPYFITTKMDEAAEWAAKRLDEDGQEAAARRVREQFRLLPGRKTGTG
ncbi:hypothetical protein [Vitiosangium sp. GDMCC 1.1324]|uniref:hypothetical protein n=1 Tax=Vitiosangium sp. (strain GDMCC 1.1324) TaxID=2138576 RepID=UPI000D3841A9|nr:hypothetical protein [Vitiosangium sp. GDMCC 1.1324]PTL79588.1 hypothetical protein DAT35_32780 [Vitiosangium sp. GDMCC 1.1324]